MELSVDAPVSVVFVRSGHETKRHDGSAMDILSDCCAACAAALSFLAIATAAILSGEQQPKTECTG